MHFSTHKVCVYSVQTHTRICAHTHTYVCVYVCMHMYACSDDGDVRRIAKSVLTNQTLQLHYATRARDAITHAHTYNHRIANLLPWIHATYTHEHTTPQSIAKTSPRHTKPHRTRAHVSHTTRANVPQVALVYDTTVHVHMQTHTYTDFGDFDVNFHFGLSEALRRIERMHMYEVTHVQWPPPCYGVHYNRIRNGMVLFRGVARCTMWSTML